MNMNIDYKKQVVITGIKSDMQCLICQVPSNKYQKLYKKWLIKIYKYTLL